MSGNNVSLDSDNLKKLAPLCIVIGAVLAGMHLLPIGVLSGFWNLIFLAAWIFSGALYANSAVESGSGRFVTVALNGALLAAVTCLSYEILASILYTVRSSGAFVSVISVQTLLEAFLVGAIGAVAWYAYKTNSETEKSPRSPRKKSASGKGGKR